MFSWAKVNNSLESYLHESGKLDGTNFSNWKFKMQNFLESANAWLIVLGNEQRIGTPAQEQDWDKRETKAKVILKMFVKDNIIPHIKVSSRPRIYGPQSRICTRHRAQIVFWHSRENCLH